MAPAALLVKLVLSGDATQLVRPVMVPLLLATALVLVVLAVLLPAPSPAPAHPEHRVPPTAWLLVVPALLGCLLSPGAAVMFEAGQPPAPLPPPGSYPPLPPGDPIAVPLDVYAARATSDGGASLAGRVVRLTGFVSPSADGKGWSATRLKLRCCLADARPVRVEVVGVPSPPRGSWVDVTGTYVPPSSAGVPRVQPVAVDPVAAPARPNL